MSLVALRALLASLELAGAGLAGWVDALAIAGDDPIALAYVRGAAPHSPAELAAGLCARQRRQARAILRVWLGSGAPPPVVCGAAYCLAVAHDLLEIIEDSDGARWILDPHKRALAAGAELADRIAGRSGPIGSTLGGPWSPAAPAGDPLGRPAEIHAPGAWAPGALERRACCADIDGDGLRDHCSSAAHVAALFGICDPCTSKAWWG